MTKFNTFNDENTQQEGDFLNLIKDIYEKPTAQVIVSGERLNAFLHHQE